MTLTLILIFIFGMAVGAFLLLLYCVVKAGVRVAADLGITPSDAVNSREKISEEIHIIKR